MTTTKVIHWFRQDLRLADNPALTAAASHGAVLPVYILDDETAAEFALGAASRAWLQRSLAALNDSLAQNLAVYRGNPVTILQDLCHRLQIRDIFWNRCYEPWRIIRDTQLKQQLAQLGITVHSYNGSLLWEPWEVCKTDGTPYKVFTPFYRNGCLKATPPRYPLPVPKLNLFKDGNSATIDNLALRPKINWDTPLLANWQIGEAAAIKQLEGFLATGINNYHYGRDFPAQQNTSRLAPHLHFGEISPNQLWYAVRNSGDSDNVEIFCKELGWREFSYSLLYYHPDLAYNNLDHKFVNFPWQYDQNKLRAWQQGLTGIPIIDAGMRELWQTGFMHNRVRMIVASFLVKNLLQHWRDGARWFWKCLIDADLASNSASWQWIAGCGADAAPYFRIFNPVTQSQKFDPNGDYIRKYIPELAKLPTKFLFEPWNAPKEVLTAAGISLGVNYPQPLVDLKVSRAAALNAFHRMNQSVFDDNELIYRSCR